MASSDEQLQNLVASTVAAVLRQIGNPPVARTGTEDAPMRNDESSSSEDEAAWTDVIAQPRTDPTSAEGVRLAKLFEQPPPLQELKAMEGGIHRYSGVPETPPPRRHRVDTQLHTVQKKMELAMHLMVHCLEKNDKVALATAGAFLRSGAEDVLQQRRSFMAGKQAWKLPRRPDDNRPTLLTEDEEKRIKPDRQPRQEFRFRPQPAQGSMPSTSTSSRWDTKWEPRPRFRSASRGKGKGKGNFNKK